MRIKLVVIKTADFIDAHIFRHCFYRFGLCSLVAESKWWDSETEYEKLRYWMPAIIRDYYVHEYGFHGIEMARKIAAKTPHELLEVIYLLNSFYPEKTWLDEPVWELLSFVRRRDEIEEIFDES